MGLQLRSPVVTAESITKTYGLVQALRDVSIALYPGEVLGLIGPNGSGKSTLIRVLSGVTQPDRGKITWFGQSGRTPGDEVGVIHQTLGLIEGHTVLENMALGVPALRNGLGFVDGRSQRARARQALERLGLHLGLDTPVRVLAPSSRALVAVARLLQTEKSVVILDEVTATLSRREADEMLVKLRDHMPSDVAMIFVSHKFGELRELASRIVVLRDGRVTDEFDGELPSVQELTRLLAPGATTEARAGDTGASEVGAPRPTDSGPPSDDAAVLLEAEEVTGEGVGPLTLKLRAGEVVGLVGRMGSGIHEIAYLIQGLWPPTSGRLLVKPSATRAGVPAFREAEGVFGELPVSMNFTAGGLKRYRRWRSILNLGAEREEAASMADHLKVVPPDYGLPIRALSGGNQQKVLFGRAMLANPRIFVLCEPTRGVDVATRRSIYALILELKDGGSGIVIASSDPEDVASICDRVLWVEGGRITQELGQGFTAEEIGQIL